MTSLMQEPFLDQACKCGGKFIEPTNGQEWSLVCNECQTVMFCYVPMDHQTHFHTDKAKFRMWAGGFGSAKTSTCSAEMVIHALSTPNGMSLIGAQTYPQLEETAKKMYLDMMPEQFIEKYLKKDNKLVLVNGHTVLFRSFDDEGKIRSLNLTAFWIEEASEVDYGIFTQLQTRLRSHATKNHFGILSTNPDLNWIKTEFLLKSSKIRGNMDIYYIPDEDKNSNFSTHIAPTYLNKYLPPTYYEDVAKGKPTWWINRYLDGSFNHAEGMVYPMLNQNIVEPFPIPKNWERVGGADWGLNDPTVLLLGAINPDDGTVYIYDEYYQTNHAVPQHAKEMTVMIESIPIGALRYLVGDPAGSKRNINDKRTIFDHYAEYGLYFRPANNRIDAGVAKVYAWFMLGKLKIFSTCRNTVREGLNYKYKPQEIGKKVVDKPLDGDDHTMDSLRYLCAELPDNPNDLIQKSYNPREFNNEQKQDHLPYELQDDNVVGSDWYNDY